MTEADTDAEDDLGLVLHTFAAGQARPYRPRADLTKTAVLVTLSDPDASVQIEAAFGTSQELTGEFYVVVEADTCYGAARREFERSHKRVGNVTWVKTSPVLAYLVAERALVKTVLADGSHEATQIAEVGDWLVRQESGEVMVISANATPGFERRYEPADDNAAGPAPLFDPE